MLQDSLFESAGRNKRRNPVTVVVSALAHVVTVAVLVLVPLLQTQALTVPPVDMSLLLPRIETRRDITAFSAQPRAQSTAYANSNAPPIFTAPQTIPSEIATVDTPAPVVFDFLPPGAGNGVLFPGSSSGISPITPPTIEPPAPPPAPLPPPPPVSSKPIRQSSGVQAARLIYQVKPAYPPLARQTRIQGVVVLEALINKDGYIDSLRVVSGHPLLNQAALDAVRQWKYRPTMLNSEPVEVVTTVTVTFTLQ